MLDKFAGTDEQEWARGLTITVFVMSLITRPHDTTVRLLTWEGMWNKFMIMQDIVSLG